MLFENLKGLEEENESDVVLKNPPFITALLSGPGLIFLLSSCYIFWGSISHAKPPMFNL